MRAFAGIRWSATGLSLVLMATMAVAQVSVSRDGDGTVVSVPPGINCGGASPNVCNFMFPRGAHVRLHAAAAHNWVFDHWSSPGSRPCSGTGDCIFVVQRAATPVTATFVAAARLTVATTGPGGVEGPGLICNGNPGADCDEDFPPGRSVTIRAHPELGYVLVSWGGACAHAAANLSCTVRADGRMTATATFRLPTLRVTIEGDGNGTVSFLNPAGPNPNGPTTTCKTTPRSASSATTSRSTACGEQTYRPGKSVTLTVAGADGNVSWDGASPACAQGTTCRVKMTGPINLTVRIDRPRVDITLDRSQGVSPVANVVATVTRTTTKSVFLKGRGQVDLTNTETLVRTSCPPTAPPPGTILSHLVCSFGAPFDSDVSMSFQGVDEATTKWRWGGNSCPSPQPTEPQPLACKFPVATGARGPFTVELKLSPK
jgi:hypothetical protein